ncbi:MAG: CoA pyrophosphatase [Thermoplasmata archaeon]
MGTPIDRSLPALLARLTQHEPTLGSAGAAVLLVLRDTPKGPEVLLIQRTERVEDRASGQVALPGGRVDPSDASLVETALRELREEVGLAREHLLETPRFVEIRNAPAFGMHVAVLASRLAPGAGPPYVADTKEVESVFWFPVSQLDQVASVTRSTQLGDVAVSAVRFQRHIVWGFTLRVLCRFLGYPDPPRP